MNNLHQIAERVFQADIYGFRNNADGFKSDADIINDIENRLKEPTGMIETIVYLLDIIDG